MQDKFCCEEMKALVVGLGGSKQSVYKVWVDNGQLDELSLGGDVSNIVFRFCPYCGKALQQVEVKKDNTVVGQVTAILFNPDLDDQRASLQCRAYLLQDAVENARKILRTATAAGTKPGLFKVS